MKTKKKQVPTGMPAFLAKVMQDKQDIKHAIKEKKSLKELAKEKGINFVQPI
ncbi:hypothetical protein [Mucilaginibacter sp.]